MVCFVDDDIVCEGFSVSEEVYLLNHTEKTPTNPEVSPPPRLVRLTSRRKHQELFSTCTPAHSSLALGSKILIGGSICLP
jgi:hypothetical protein